MNNKVKTFFTDAALKLSELCDKIDNTEEVDEFLLQEFHQANTSLQESIDRRKYIYSEAESKIKQAKEYKKSLDATIKRLERVKKRIEDHTRHMIEAEPNIPFSDTLGNKLKIQKNAMPKLEFNLEGIHVHPLTRTVSVPNVLDAEAMSYLDIDESYLKTVSYITLDTEKLKEDLKTKELSWAKVTHGTHLKGLKI